MPTKKKAAPKPSAKPRRQIILVVLEGGCVQEVTTRYNEDWTAFDWDDFRESPLDYWNDLSDDAQHHIRFHWPQLHEEIQGDLEKHRAKLAKAEAEKAEQARIAGREHYVIEFQHAETMNVFRTEADLTPEEVKEVQRRLDELAYPASSEPGCIVNTNIEKPFQTFAQDFQQLMEEINQEIGAKNEAV